MSRILWNIGNLINDPAADDIVTTLHRVLFKKRDDPAPTIQENLEDDENICTSKDVKKNNYDGISIASSSKRTFEGERRSECVQVGNGSTNNSRNLAIQCHRTILKKANKSTSPRHITFNDNCTTPRFTNSGNKDCKQTNTSCSKICCEHQNAFRVLKHWSICGKSNRQESLMNRLKNRFKDSISSLQFNKIENVPPYHSGEKSFMKLYLNVSEDIFKSERNSS